MFGDGLGSRSRQFSTSENGPSIVRLTELTDNTVVDVGEMSKTCNSDEFASNTIAAENLYVVND
uniref:Uncharacterized protein n=1 Tax=Romanomermis culicivorax TaxID=13658 RepID=A0A915KCK6_ROMCU